MDEKRTPAPWTWRRTWTLATLLALACVGSIAGLDVRLARAIHGAPDELHRAAHAFTRGLDVLSGKVLSDALLPLLLLLAALGLRFRARRSAGLALLLVTCTALPHLVVGIVKRLAGRLRPEKLPESGWVDHFFAGGHSFPSGHTAFYAGLLLPLAWAWPRARPALLLLALLVPLARVLENDHFAGDVLGSLALTLVSVRALVELFERRGWHRLGDPSLEARTRPRA